MQNQNHNNLFKINFYSPDLNNTIWIVDITCANISLDLKFSYVKKKIYIYSPTATASCKNVWKM